MATCGLDWIDFFVASDDCGVVGDRVLSIPSQSVLKDKMAAVFGSVMGNGLVEVEKNTIASLFEL
jgi:hypothetical protein